MATPVAKRINVVWLYVRDVKRSVAFYNETLGIPIQLHPDDPHWAEYTFPEGGRFALHQAGADTKVGSDGMQLDFQVDDIDRAVATLRDRGVTCSDIEREPWGSACELHDPDGYRIGLFQPPV